MASHPTGAARPASTGQRRLALALVAVAVLAVVLVIALLTADDKPLDAGGEPIHSSPAQKKPPATKTSSSGTLTAGGRTLLPLPGKGFQGMDGTKVTGRAVPVLTSSKRGFWIGQSPSERLFVATDETAKLGTRVDLDGKVVEASGKGLGLGPIDARQVAAQSGYVKASDVKPAGSSRARAGRGPA